MTKILASVCIFMICFFRSRKDKLGGVPDPPFGKTGSALGWSSVPMMLIVSVSVRNTFLLNNNGSHI